MLVLFSSFSKAQFSEIKKDKLLTLAIMTRIEATNIDGKAFLSVGSKIPLDDRSYVGLKGHFNWWDLPGRKFIVIPELDYIRTTATFEDKNPFIPNLYTGVGISPYAVSPKFGIVFYHFFAVEVGNNFEYNEYKYFPQKVFGFLGELTFFFKNLI
jgi:hypothetical protein